MKGALTSPELPGRLYWLEESSTQHPDGGRVIMIPSTT